MRAPDAAQRLGEKSSLVAIQVELQNEYSLSPIEARVLARRVQELVDERIGMERESGQISYHAIAINEPPGKPLRECRKVAVDLTLFAEEDTELWATEDPLVLRCHRVQRLVYEASAQGGALSQEDLACLLGISTRTIKRIFALFREKGQHLPSRGEIQDMGRGVSHKIPVIRKYVQDVSFSRISLELGRHGIPSMARYLRHFALVMLLEDRGFSAEQMQSVIGTSENLIEQYRSLYAELNVPENARTLERLKGTVLHPPEESEMGTDTAPGAAAPGPKGGLE